MRIESRTEGDVMVLEVKDRRIDARSAPDLKQKIGTFVSGGAEWIVLDLSEVEFVDSSGLGAIVSALKLLGRRGDLVISGARESVQALFKLTRMDKVFRMFPTVQEAQQALAARV
jgi:anti-sigma B factor antagonist